MVLDNDLLYPIPTVCHIQMLETSPTRKVVSNEKRKTCIYVCRCRVGCVVCTWWWTWHPCSADPCHLLCHLPPSLAFQGAFHGPPCEQLMLTQLGGPPSQAKPCGPVPCDGLLRLLFHHYLGNLAKKGCTAKSILSK